MNLHRDTSNSNTSPIARRGPLLAALVVGLLFTFGNFAGFGELLAQTPVDNPPASSAFQSVKCVGGSESTDPPGDISAPQALPFLDIIGTSQAPASYVASDSDFFYYRIRINGDPKSGGNKKSLNSNGGWGVLFNQDGDFSNTFEHSLIAKGQNNNDDLLFTEVSTNQDIQYTPANKWWFSQPAGDGVGYFLTIAMKCSDLRSKNYDANGAYELWGGASTNKTTLNKDLVCSDGNQKQGAGLDISAATASDPTTLFGEACGGGPVTTDPCPDLPGTDYPDGDEDGWGNVCDNCPDLENEDQADSDGDGIWDCL